MDPSGWIGGPLFQIDMDTCRMPKTAQSAGHDYRNDVLVWSFWLSAHFCEEDFWSMNNLHLMGSCLMGLSYNMSPKKKKHNPIPNYNVHHVISNLMSIFFKSFTLDCCRKQLPLKKKKEKIPRASWRWCCHVAQRACTTTRHVWSASNLVHWARSRRNSRCCRPWICTHKVRSRWGKGGVNSD